MVTTAVSHACGVASSHTWYTKVSTPTNPGFGVYTPVTGSNVPLVGGVTTVGVPNVSPFGSKSFDKMLIVTGWPSSVVAVSSFATTSFVASGSFGFGITSIVNVAVSHACGVPLSHTVYVWTNVPVKSVAGVKVYVPSAFNTNVPSGVVVIEAVTVCAWPCGSESLVNTFPETGTFINVLLMSFSANVVLGVSISIHVVHPGTGSGVVVVTVTVLTKLPNKVAGTSTLTV